MFGFSRRHRFETAVLEEMAYMLDLHGLTPRAAARLAARLRRNAARQRAPLALRG